MRSRDRHDARQAAKGRDYKRLMEGRAQLGGMHEHTAVCQCQSRVGGGAPPRGGNACNRLEEHAACGALLKTWCMDWAGPCLSACGRAGLTPHAPMQRSRTMRGECWFRQDAAGRSILQGPVAVRACGKCTGSLAGHSTAGASSHKAGRRQALGDGRGAVHRAGTKELMGQARTGRARMGQARWPSAVAERAAQRWE